LTVPLVVPSAYPALAGARESGRASEANYEVAETAILAEVVESFFVAAGLDELMAARRDAIAVAERTQRDAEKRVAAGIVNAIEVTRAQLALVRAGQELRETENQRGQAYRALATLIQIPRPFVVAAPPSDRGPLPEIDELLPQAWAARPEHASYIHGERAAELQASAAAWRWAPTVSGFGSLRGFNYTGFAGDHYNWALGVQLDWTLYDGGQRDVQRARARVSARENRLRLDQWRDTLADELRNRLSTLEVKRSAVEVARTSVELARRTLELARAQHEVGTIGQLDLLQAQDGLVAAEVALTRARFDSALAELQLRRASGEFPNCFLHR
jgi:outer membrane protein TolC